MVWIVLSGLLGPSSAWAQDLLAMAKPADSAEWGYIDPSGAFAVAPQYRKCFPFSEDGFAPIYDKKRKTWVFVDTSGGELAAEAQPLLLKSVMGFGTIGFTDGRAPMTVKKKWGFLGTDGKIAIQPTYDKVTQFSGGYAIAEKGESFVVLDPSGAEAAVKMPGVLAVKRFSEGLAPAKGENQLFGFVDTMGAVAIEPKFKSVGHFVDGLAWAKTGEGMVGFIDPSGAWAIEAKYRAAKPFGPGSGLARVKLVDTWEFVRIDGSLAKVAAADSFKDFSEGLCMGKVGDLVGFFNTEGTWVIKPSFQAVRPFHNGYAAAKQGDKWGVIDKTGAWVVKPILDGIRDFEKTSR